MSNSAKDLLEKYIVEINKHDFDRVEPLIARDCKFWFTSGTYSGLQEARQAFEKTWAMIQNEVYSLSDMEWISQGQDSAACTYTYRWAGLIGGVQREGKGRGTSCFRKDADQWKLVHEHLSSFPTKS